jgi:hypothetical protein
MLNEIRVEIGKLTKDSTFVRNLSLTSIIAIAGFCGLSGLPGQNIAGSEEALVASIAYGNGIAHADITQIIIKN